MKLYIINMPPNYASPPDPKEYQLRVWEIVKQIPPGKVATYGQVASLVQLPDGISPQDYRAFGARWVGRAMASCPSDVPWQRVINSQGKISLSGSSAETQRRLLEEEGVVFDDRGRVNLKKYQWQTLAV
jgi:methylated-DNA-protein-cysteine methyltransferase-like protein